MTRAGTTLAHRAAAAGAGIRTGIAKDIWLHICGEGGTWTPDEIAARFDLPRQAAALTMHRMAARIGTLKQYSASRGTKFGVTPECKVPQGISLAELAKVGAIRLEVA